MTNNDRIWTRLKPKITDENDLAGLRAEIQDPLWTLGRQWQVGDLQGEDGGSPVRVDCWVERDRATRYDLGGGPTDYNPDDVPLETVVERESVISGGNRPDMGTAVETGLHFLRLLDQHGYAVSGDSPTAADFENLYRLDKSDYEAGVAVPESEEARRFEMVVDDRALDGYDVYQTLVTEVSNLASADGPEDESISWPSPSSLPVPGQSIDAPYRRAAKDFVDWYEGLFDEPSGDDDAWDESRLEYGFDVATGEGDDETVFSVSEYPGGRLDWSSFDAEPTASLSEGGSSSGSSDGDTGVTEDAIAQHASITYDSNPTERSTESGETAILRPDLSRLPSPVTYPGMPTSRWWELEDGTVNLFDTDIGPGELGTEIMIDFAVTFGQDWFSVPLETTVGTTNRITALAVVDTFGAMEVAEPSLEVANQDWENEETDAEDDIDVNSQWKLFTDELGPNHDEPGLFVPPTLAENFESDLLERVVFARDELANIAWAIEERVLDPYGIRIDMDEHEEPSLKIVGIQPNEDPAEEYVEMGNPGDEPINVGDWKLDVMRATESGTTTETFELGTDPGDVTVAPESSLRVVPHVGSDTDTTLYWDWDDSSDQPPLLVEAQKIVLRNGREWPVSYRDLRTETGGEQLPAYRLASDVADNWYPLKPRQVDYLGGFEEKDTTFALARLVDADVDILPTPKGDILRAYVPETESEDVPTIHDEELTRAGAEVTRSYQLARWIDGGTHMWSARQSQSGYGQGDSGLRYDYLESPNNE